MTLLVVILTFVHLLFPAIQVDAESKTPKGNHFVLATSENCKRRSCFYWHMTFINTRNTILTEQ